jgi:broad specificity phosphatase PhoE
MSDPDAAPHGGESLAAFSQRIVEWLETAATTGDGFLAAVVDAGVVKASVVHVLGAPASGFWRVDVSPLMVTELHGHQGHWTLSRCNAPLARPAGVRYGS